MVPLVNASRTKIHVTFIVFWRRAPLQNMAAGNSSANSHIPPSIKGGTRRRVGSQTSSRGTIDSRTHNQFTNFDKWFFPYPWCFMPSDSWSSPSLPTKLASDNVQSMGDPSCERVQVRSQGEPLHLGGDSEAGDQGCSREGYPLCESIPQPDISGSQEGWLGEVGDQPETSESVYPPTTFQDGEFNNDQRPAERRGLDGLNRPEGCLPLSDDMGRPPEVLEIHMAGQSV